MDDYLAKPIKADELARGDRQVAAGAAPALSRSPARILLAVADPPAAPVFDRKVLLTSLEGDEESAAEIADAVSGDLPGHVDRPARIDRDRRLRGDARGGRTCSRAPRPASEPKRCGTAPSDLEKRAVGGRSVSRSRSRGIVGRARSSVQSPHGPGRGEGRPDVRILVAEDDAASRLLLQKVLTKWGYEVVTAESGDGGVEGADRR